MDSVTVADDCVDVSATATDPIRQSCSNLPISIRMDRFNDRRQYAKMYSYNGLIDTKHYLSIERILKTVNRWDFNIFALERFSSGFPLTYLAVNLFEVHDLIRYFKLDISKVYQFFMTIERSYHPSNPYHNALHAADVTQAINCIIGDKKIWSQLSKKDILCSFLSTICHDVDHPGLNNMFMNNSQHHLSLLYKKESVLENHHWAFSLSVLRETGLFSDFDVSLWQSVTETCRSLIRATDISKQNTYLINFNKTLLPVNPRRSADLSSEEEKLLVLQMAIKCADICNPCRRWDICNCWAYLVTEEFFQQGDKEKEMFLPVSSIMDREKTRLAIVQRDFISYLVLPLFRVWNQFIDSDISRRFLEHIDSNQAMWQRLVDKSVEESDDIILHSIQSLYDRMQLMQVMDYTKDHQLSHLHRLRLLVDSNLLEEAQSCDEVTEMAQNPTFDPCRLDILSDMIEEGHTKLYHQRRRGSLPISLAAGNKDASVSFGNQKKSAPSNRQKLVVRRKSLQHGPGGTTSTTSITSTAVAVSRGGPCFSIGHPNHDQGIFPTASRRKSAPAIKINPPSLFDNHGSSGRRGSLASYFCPAMVASGLCSSQSMLYDRLGHSSSDIQIAQVG